MKKPFAILAEMANGRDWRARLEDFRTALLSEA
jgi:hypothetical protein